MAELEKLILALEDISKRADDIILKDYLKYAGNRARELWAQKVFLRREDIAMLFGGSDGTPQP